MALGTVSSSLPPYENDTTALPQYSCDTSLTGNLLLKQELETPIQAAYQRQWRKVTGEVRGTLLIITTVDQKGIALATRSYTLQAADVGIATDYIRRPNVIRVRAEGEQFLLATSSLLHVIVWLERLSAAIAISLDLDEREIPYPRTVPTRRSSLPTTEHRAAAEPRIQELWWTRKKENCWLAQTQPLLDAETPDPILAQSLAAEDDHRLSMGGGLKQERCASMRSRNIFTESLTGEPRRASSWSDIVSARILKRPWNRKWADFGNCDSQEDSVRDLQCFGDDCDGKWNPETLHCEDKLEYAHRCARKLRYCSTWKGGYYVKGDKIVPIPTRMTAAYRNPQYRQWD